MPDLGDALRRWKRVPKDVGLKFDEARGIAECDVPHPIEPGWRVLGRFLLSEHRLVLVEVRVFSPAVAGTVKGRPVLPPEAADGITMRMLSEIRRSELFEPVQSWAALRSAGRSMAHAVYAEMAASPNPGSHKRDDWYYAEWAQRIHEATISGSRSPIRDVAEEAGLTREQVRDLATEARVRKLYVPLGKGRGGGYLTDKGREVLKKQSRKVK